MTDCYIHISVHCWTLAREASAFGGWELKQRPTPGKCAEMRDFRALSPIGISSSNPSHKGSETNVEKERESAKAKGDG